MVQNNPEQLAAPDASAPSLYATSGALGMIVLNRHVPNSAGGINIEHVATVKTVGETFLASDGWRTVEHRVVRS